MALGRFFRGKRPFEAGKGRGVHCASNLSQNLAASASGARSSHSLTPFIGAFPPACARLAR